jgi:tetratricopeptide (TPR) repeat protein
MALRISRVVNVTLLHKRILVLFALLAVTPAAADERADKAHYDRCLAAAQANPAGALGDATSWTHAGGGAPAEHCAALALLGLKRYAEAGTRLDALARSDRMPQTAMRATLFDQAGNAFLLAGDGARAASSLRAALALSASDPDLLADMGRAEAMRRNFSGALSYLNAALALAPRRADLLVLRASARRAVKQYGPAKADIDAALAAAPGNAEALLERGQLRRQIGDVAGAKKDFQAALAAHPGAQTQAAARDSLDTLGE